MHETSKSLRRRYADGAFHTRFLVGEGLDVGGGDDPLAAQAAAFAGIRSLRSWDLADGDGQRLEGVPDASFDFVYSSHCLEHLEDPVQALSNWLRVLRPGGHLIVTVPDEDLYEQGVWPSRFNPTHRWSFTICKAGPSLPNTISVLELVRVFAEHIECERVNLIRDFHRPDLEGVDQTQTGAECAIEFVWRKRRDLAAEWIARGDQALGRYQDDQARDAYEAAVRDNPRSFEASHRLALMHMLAHDHEAVARVWARSVEHLPGAHLPRLYQALFELSRGHYQAGFRLRDPCVPDERRTPLAPPPDLPRWQGEALAGRCIIIWTEFGFGDELMFARFASVFRRQLGAAEVRVVCQAPLLRLFERGLLGADRVVSDEQVAASRAKAHPPIEEGADYWVFPHTIGSHFAMSRDQVPAPIPYLSVPAAQRRAARARLPDRVGGHLRVGLVWRGNPTHENDAARSLPGLFALEPLFGLASVSFFSLQKGEVESEVADFRHRRAPVTPLGQSLKDFADTAALVAELDLVICVDTAVAHLAGALGVEAWVLLPVLPDWRWQLDRDDSPWYPQMRLFRQERPGEWAPVIARVAETLSRRIDARRAGA